jgi:hypothetical protein
MPAVNSEAPNTTDSRMMIAAKQIAARRNVTCPTHHLGLGNGMTRPLRVSVVGANPNRGWARDSHIPALSVKPDHRRRASGPVRSTIAALRAFVLVDSLPFRH